jgi:hypothetical protein
LPNGFGWGLIGLGQINTCIGLATNQACIQDCTPLRWWVLKVGWCLKTDLWVDIEHTPWLPWLLKISLLWDSPQFLVFCSDPGSPINYFCDWQCWQFGTGQLRMISLTGGEDKPQRIWTPKSLCMRTDSWLDSLFEQDEKALGKRAPKLVPW